MSVLGVYPFYWCIPLVHGPLESACVCVCGNGDLFFVIVLLQEKLARGSINWRMFHEMCTVYSRRVGRGLG